MTPKTKHWGVAQFDYYSGQSIEHIFKNWLVDNEFSTENFEIISINLLERTRPDSIDPAMTRNYQEVVLAFAAWK